MRNEKDFLILPPIALICLIPGFFYSSVKFYLEIPSLLAVSLVIWALISKQKPLVVGLALALVILTKEYYFFLLLPVALVVVLTDASTNNSKFWYKLKNAVLNSIWVGLPGVLASMVLVDFNIGPYARMLENTWIELFKDSFILINKYFLMFIDKIGSLFSGGGISSLNLIANKAQQIPIGNNFVTRAVLESPITPEKHGFFQTLWIMYKSNFFEQDISLFILSLTIIGMALCVQKIFRDHKGKRFIENRTPIIFLSVMVMFLFFNLQQAKNMQGFRINIPIVFVMIYFSCVALKKFLEAKSVKLAISFLSLVSFFIVLYIIQDRSISLSSVLQGGILSTLYGFKVYFFILLFIVFALFLAFNNWLSINRKTKELTILFFAFLYLFLKIAPFFLDYRAEVNAHGSYFNVKDSSQIMREVLNNKLVIHTNLTCHVVYYNSGWYQLPNDNFSPRYRTLPEVYPTLCKDFEYTNISAYFDSYENKKESYILFVNNDRYNKWSDFESFYEKNNERLEIISSEYKNNEPLWLFIKIEAVAPPEDGRKSIKS